MCVSFHLLCLPMRICLSDSVSMDLFSLWISSSGYLSVSVSERVAFAPMNPQMKKERKFRKKSIVQEEERKSYLSHKYFTKPPIKFPAPPILPPQSHFTIHTTSTPPPSLTPLPRNAGFRPPPTLPPAPPHPHALLPIPHRKIQHASPTIRGTTLHSPSLQAHPPAGPLRPAERSETQSGARARTQRQRRGADPSQENCGWEEMQG